MPAKRRGRGADLGLPRQPTDSLLTCGLGVARKEPGAHSRTHRLADDAYAHSPECGSRRARKKASADDRGVWGDSRCVLCSGRRGVSPAPQQQSAGCSGCRMAESPVQSVSMWHSWGCTHVGRGANFREQLALQHRSVRWSHSRVPRNLPWPPDIDASAQDLGDSKRQAMHFSHVGV